MTVLESGEIKVSMSWQPSYVLVLTRPSSPASQSSQSCFLFSRHLNVAIAMIMSGSPWLAFSTRGRTPTGVDRTRWRSWVPWLLVRRDLGPRISSSDHERREPAARGMRLKLRGSRVGYVSDWQIAARRDVQWTNKRPSTWCALAQQTSE